MAATPIDERTALEPLAGALTVVGALLAALAIAVAIALPFGEGSAFGRGETQICVTAPTGAVPIVSDGRGIQTVGLHSGAAAQFLNAYVCKSGASTGLHVLQMLTSLPDTLVLIGSLLMFWRLIRLARRGGLFTSTFSRGLRTLGWFLLVGTVVASTAQAIARTAILTQLIAYQHLGDFTGQWHISVATLLAGCALLSFARVLAAGGRMRTELDLTV